MRASYSDTVDLLYALQRHGIKLGLDTITELLTRLGAPHRRYPSIHIGGTNGKGSTATMVASILQAAGYRVGLYTSPHLIDFRERMKVNQVPVSEEEVIESVHQIREAAGPTLTPTFFEFTTAMAFQHFADAQVDVAVLEVGMGGRFDATNVIQPIVTGITNVALDHEQYLGRELESIAFEKAGILKPYVPVVVGRLDPGPERVIRAVAEEQQVPVFTLGREYVVEGESPHTFAYKGVQRSLTGLVCPLRGDHQRENAACALGLIELVAGRGLPVPTEAIHVGLQTVRWEGRLEIAETCPILLMDGAHNPAAARVVARYLAEQRQTHAISRVIGVIGMMRDKDHDRFLETLLPVVDEFVVTEPSLARSASVHDLGASLQGRAEAVHHVPVPAEALARARERSGPEDLICVTGSLMLVGEVKALLRGSALSPIRG
jgi:dihydrofolate synthase / folylpolyglutamate synthase